MKRTNSLSAICILIIVCMTSMTLHAQQRTAANEIDLEILINAGGGYDTNLFRERFPLNDDFDYPPYQPEKKKKSPLFDIDGNIRAGYFLPLLPIWKKSKITVGALGQYNRVTESSDDSKIENYYQWGLSGDWFIKFTGSNENEGFYMIIRDHFTRIKYTEAKDRVNEIDQSYPTDNYNVSENIFKLGLGYRFTLGGQPMPPIGFEYKHHTRSSPEKENNENYDFGPGPRTIKLYTGAFAGRMSIKPQSGREYKNTEVKRADVYRSILYIDGFALKFSGEIWSRDYTTWRARDLSNTVQIGNPLLSEARLSYTLDLHIGSMAVAPLLEITQTSGAFFRYEYYRNDDNYKGYYDYSWHRGHAGYILPLGPVKITARYELHYKIFDKRKISTGDEKREDLFHVGAAEMKIQFNDLIAAALDYSYIHADSNEKLTAVNYNKHYGYIQITCFTDAGHSF